MSEYGPWKDSGIDSTQKRSAVGYERDPAAWEKLCQEREANRLLCNAWREAAVADGWAIEQTYSHEPVEQAFRLKREGFIVQGIARPRDKDTYRHETFCPPNLSIYGPDGAAIVAPINYDWEAIKAGLYICDRCGAFDVETKRYAFANRCCAECGPKFMASLPRNWAD